MPATLHPDFRSGNLNEDLGMLLLRCFSAVAPVPRPDDVGIDAVATLLRKESDDCLVAEDSFYVQFKSPSDRTVNYRGHAVKWLLNLKLPLFIGKVDKRKGSIDLYCTHRLSQQVIGAAPQEIELTFAPTEHRAGVTSIDISPPVLSWTTDAFADQAFADKAYELLKAVIKAEQMNIDFRPVGYCQGVSWETNISAVERPGNPSLAHGPTAIPQNIARLLPPLLFALALDARGKGNQEAIDLIFKLVESVRQRGLELDPNHILSAIMVFRRPLSP